MGERPVVWAYLSLIVVLVLPGSEAEPNDGPTATRLNAIEVVLERGGLVVTLTGDGVLVPSSIHEAEHWPPRLVIDLPDVTALVPAETRVDVRPVDSIRVALHSHDPLVTRVVLDLSGPTNYEIEGAEGSGEKLRVVFPLLTEQDDEPDPLARHDESPAHDAPVGAARWLPTRAVYASPGRAAARPVTYEVPVPGLLVGLPARPVAPSPVDDAWSASLPVTLSIGITDVGTRLTPESLPPASGGSDVVGDDVALQYGMAAVGVPLDPEAAPTVEPVVMGLAAIVQSPGGSPETRTQSRTIVPRQPTAGPRAQLQQVTSGGQTPYTGDPVSMDFQNADLRAVLRTFAEISALNIVIHPQVEGSVDVSLTDVPWDQAFDIILRANRLGYIVDGTVVRIAPLLVLAEEEAQRRALAEEQALAGDLIVLTRTLSYARAADMVDLVTPLLSARGTVQIDKRTNTMIMTDLQDRLGTVDDLLDTLDRAEPQVEIEARIVQAGRDFARAIGVQWGITGRVAPDLGNTTALTFPNRGGVSGRLGTQGPEADRGDARAFETENTGTAVNLPAAVATSAFGVTLGSVDGSLNLDIALSAAESDGQVKLLSHARVTTQNNVQAEIVQGDQIPIQVMANNTVTVTFQDAALSLRVTPQITAADTVIMQIEIQNDFADFGREIQGIPPIVTQRASTTVQVANGDTTVIGGIFESERSRSDNRVPLLHRILLLGWLFKSRPEPESTDELLIFLTPRIIR